MDNFIGRTFLSSSLVLLMTACGGSDSETGAQTQAQNQPPIAQAGANQSVATSTLVTLDGSASSDADGDLISYQWLLTTIPTGSTAHLSGSTSARPTFTSDVDGTYVAQLIVNDGVDESAVDIITVNSATANTAPTANAGANQNVATNTLVTLNGSGSSDLDGDTLSYQWSLMDIPSGSLIELSDITASSPTFTSDVDGSYIIQLIVNDGSDDSTADSITIISETSNSAPVADTGEDQNVATNTIVTLNGTASSDADGDSISYYWSFITVPLNSTAVLSNRTQASPTFEADKDGTYVIQLIVNDGTEESAPATTTITSATQNSAPMANAGADQNVATSTVVVIDGTDSSDADGDELSYNWSFTTKPDGSLAALSDVNASSPTFTTDIDGTYVIQLIVNDGNDISAADTITIVSATLNSAPMADAGIDRIVTPGSIVTLNGGGSSDADGDGLLYSWSFVSKPSESGAEFDDLSAMNPSFTADVEGSYVISLIVNDSMMDSVADNIQVDVIQPSVKLFSKSGFFGATFNEVSLPYNMSGVSSASVTGIPMPTTYTLSTFKLLAQGQDFTIINLNATDSSSTVIPFFTEISDGFVVPNGVEMEFELITPLTGGQTVNLNFSFEIQETGETFSVSYMFTSN